MKSSSEYIFVIIDYKICLQSSQIFISYEIGKGFSGEDEDEKQHILNISVLLLNCLKISCLSSVI